MRFIDLSGPALALVLGLGAAGAGHAAQTAYTDKTAFIAAAGPLSFESFETLSSYTSDAPGGQGHVVDATFGAVEVTAQPGQDYAWDGAGTYFPTDGVGAVGAYGQAGITFTFSHPIKAFGIDMIGAGTAGFPTDISFVTANGTQTLYAGIEQNFFDYVLFGGVTDSKGFTSVTIYGTDGEDFIAYDSLRFGAGLTGGVPEPGAWAVMLLGLGAVGALVRRRRVVREHAG